MPLTVIDIERRKRWRIGLLYTVLLSLYLFTALALYGLIFLVVLPFRYAGESSGSSPYMPLVVIILGALAIASIHFWISASTVLGSVVRTLKAGKPDREDVVHQRLLNVMQEVRLFTNIQKMECLVIPSLSFNALAATDLKGNAVIAVTEGLISRLSRPQLEAVIAHEVYHVISGDCLETTIATSLFGVYASLMDQLRSWSEDDRETLYQPNFFAFFALLNLSNLLSMFISREREYRADAAAVRMTRNPIALAEALHLISRNWNGGGMISSGLEMLCITSPVDSRDESEGWLADLLSTHPPMEKRIRTILRYAHRTYDDFAAIQDRTDEAAESGMGSGGSYYALDNKRQWQGPFSLVQLAAVPWLTPRTWLSGADGRPAFRAADSEFISGALSLRMGSPSGYMCPNCSQPLQKTEYEGTQVHQCVSCGGTLVDNDKIPRIIARREKICSGRVKALAGAVLRDNQRAMTISKVTGRDIRKKSGNRCQKCGNVMFRTFYSGAYLIEIDRCNICRITWFDIDELEMLQCLIENKITGILADRSER
jgi:heat shock protein HtpX